MLHVILALVAVALFLPAIPVLTALLVVLALGGCALLEDLPAERRWRRYQDWREKRFGRWT